MNAPLIVPHESWFTPVQPPYDWSFTFQPVTLALIATAVAAAVAWRLIGRRLPHPELPFLAPLGRLAPWVPRLLAIHAGVSMLAQASRGTYLAPSLDLPNNAFGLTLRIAEGVLGLWLITGFRIRAAAMLVVVAGPAGMFRYGFGPILERMDLLGIALFLALLPPGPDRWGEAPVSPERVRVAVSWLRTLVAGSLIVLAFTEKLARPALAVAFLDRYPAFNILRTLGFDASDATFIRIAGAVELLFGLLLLSGTLPQLVVIIAGIPFNATLFFLGSEELIGHLPIYGAMLALLVYGSSRELAPEIERFQWRPPDVSGSRRTEPARR